MVQPKQTYAQFEITRTNFRRILCTHSFSGLSRLTSLAASEIHWIGPKHHSRAQTEPARILRRQSILLTEYMNQVAPTDELPADDLQPILVGLFGEVGSIMATAKTL